MPKFWGNVAAAFSKKGLSDPNWCNAPEACRMSFLQFHRSRHQKKPSRELQIWVFCREETLETAVPLLRSSCLSTHSAPNCPFTFEGLLKG
jgi:hypothetical protein